MDAQKYPFRSEVGRYHRSEEKTLLTMHFDSYLRVMVNQHRKGIFFDVDNTEHIYFSAVVHSGKIGMTEVKICDLKGLKRCEIFLKQIPTMTVSKWSWRKPPGPEKGDVIRTRLILPDAVTAAKNHAIRRGSVRTICPCKDLSRTVKEGAGQALLPVPIHAPPGQADSSYVLIKINDGSCSNTPPGSHKSRHIIPTKRGCCP